MGLRVLLFLALAWSPAGVWPQTASPDSTMPLLQAPRPGDSPTDNRVFSPARIFQKPISAGISYDLKEKPVGSALAPMPARENKTNSNKAQEQEKRNQQDDLAAKIADPTLEARAPFEFVGWVQNSVGRNLQVFGADLFDGKDQNNAALDPLTVPTDYRVGPGDELLIRAWGQIDIDYQGPIDRSGRVFLPKIGQVMVAGQKLSDLRNLVATLIGKQFKQFELTVTLGALRQIQFYVAGFVRQPGIHTTESTATALHGLLSAGGPLPSGDLRHIEVRRGNQVVNVIDAYDFLAKGDKSADPALQPGDIVYVPAAQGFVAVAGSVRRPAIYHLKTPSTVADLLQLGGGQSFSQTQLTARLERLRQGKRQVETLTLDAQQLQRPLQDGDLLIVLPPTPQFDQVVTLRGNVAEPLRQNWHAGMRVSDLIHNSSALVRFSTWIRQNSRNSLLNMFDSARDTDFRRDFPDVNWDYATLERLDPATLSSQLLTFNLSKALEKDPLHDLTLQSGDTIVVFSKNDFRQPQNKKLRMVKLEGEINAPGIYPAEPGETMVDLIQKAGGLTPQAFVFGMTFSRESARKEEAQRYQEIADRMEQDYLRYLAGRTKNAMSQEEGMIGSGEIEVVKALVTRLRTQQPDGRIALNLGSPNAGLQDLPTVSMEDQDTLLIPTKPSTVTVVGSVMKQGSLFWRPNWNAQDYIDNAGGLHAQANRSGIVIFRADGTVRKNATWSIRDALNPGDTIVVPEDVSSVSWSRLFRDWSQIFYQLALGGAALKVLRSGL